MHKAGLGKKKKNLLSVFLWHFHLCPRWEWSWRPRPLYTGCFSKLEKTKETRSSLMIWDSAGYNLIQPLYFFHHNTVNIPSIWMNWRFHIVTGSRRASDAVHSRRGGLCFPEDRVQTNGDANREVLDWRRPQEEKEKYLTNMPVTYMTILYFHTTKYLNSI